MKKRVAIIGTVGLPANYGGFETLTEHIVENMSDEYDITVYCSGKRYPKEEQKQFYKNARLRYLPLEANGIQSIFYDTLSILHAVFFSEVLLILGVAGAWILPFVKFFTNRKIIISIDGIEWKRDKWNILAKWYLFWAEGLAVKYSHIDISDNEAIQDYTAMRYGSLSRIIEYGADHTLKVNPKKADLEEYPFLHKPYAFKVCRIEPENNVHNVLQAFSELPNYTLVMVGNWKNSDYGLDVRARYEQFSNIILLDPIYNQEKLDVLRGNALVYIHGHSAGGTNPSLVEAMYLGLPIITYGVSYNKVTTENQALYFNTAEDLKNIVMSVKVDELKALGKKMEAIAERRYTWKLIVEKYKALIVEALNVKSKQNVAYSTAELRYDQLLEMNMGHLKNQESFFTKR
ncbi:rhamnosyltransferase [Marivirga lumbricoides]|uniref:Glycosyl transferase n=1 Tax=Marivirga lumbricoides TaxID=1046115 RepID=A0A2T4DNC5_9BACT|nr:glycosyl transferase [Marivirga lumbricoides]GGC47808.1 rhamnosyltransferase [Marivirga lumbricoides]